MGAVKQYYIWHINQYGNAPTDFSKYRDFLIEEEKLIRSQTYIFGGGSSDTANKDIKIYSPSLELLANLKQKKITLEDIHWRQFEEIVAELLSWEGWSVKLGRGSKDGNVDILAEKKDPSIGRILTVWQAKKLHLGNKVGISTIRELADTRIQNKASKAVIVTSTYLTRGALDRIQCDEFLFSKVDRIDFFNWIQAYDVN